jgi:hypothetical protein
VFPTIGSRINPTNSAVIDPPLITALMLPTMNSAQSTTMAVEAARVKTATQV